MEQTECLGRAMEFDMEPIVQRYAREHNVTLNVAREHERELKRYLFLSAQHPRKPYAMKGPVDKLWHTFIIFTHRYSEFCDLAV